MARLKRLALGGHPHHIALFGLAGLDVFVDDHDFALYTNLLRKSCAEQRVAVHAYALLPDRVLLLATPPDEASLSRLMQSLGRQYVAAYNRRHGRAGTLWQGRFRAAPVEASTQLIHCMRHVEQAPVRAGRVSSAAAYAWSSAAHHVGALAPSEARPAALVSAALTDHPVYWRLGNTPFEREAAYGRLLAEPLGAELTSRIEAAVQRGWALGSGEFLASVSSTTSRPAAPRPRGRPKKATASPLD